MGSHSRVILYVITTKRKAGHSPGANQKKKVRKRKQDQTDKKDKKDLPLILAAGMVRRFFTPVSLSSYIPVLSAGLSVYVCIHKKGKYEKQLHFLQAGAGRVPHICR